MKYDIDIDDIVVEEGVEYTVKTEDGFEGMGVKVLHLRDGKYHSVADIDGLSMEQMRHVRQFTIELLRYIKTQTEAI